MKYIIILLLSFLSCSNSSNESLEIIVKSNSYEGLHDFLDNWGKKSQSISVHELNKKPLIEQNIYKLFNIFYNPKIISEKIHSEWGHNLFESCRFVIIQNNIEVDIANNISQDTITNTIKIENFRPRISNVKFTPLFLTKEYSKHFNQLFNSEMNYLGYLRVDRRNYPEIIRKMNFLNKYLQVSISHWGEYLYVVSPPVIEKIIIDKEYNNAKILFRFGWELWQATYAKENENWQLLKLCEYMIE